MSEVDPNVRFEVEKIDIDGDGIPDGDLVKKLQKGAAGWKVVSQKFVPAEKMQMIAANAIAAGQYGSKEQVVYQRQPINEDNKPVIIKDETNFGQYVKEGAGLQLGAGAVAIAFAGLASLFSDGGKSKKGARKRHL